MKAGFRFWAILLSAVCVLIFVYLIFIAKPQPPVAILRVMDATGKPVAGAVINPEGMRTKPGPYQSGWYGWRSQLNGVPNPPVTTDRNGYASVPYPKFVFERIETGTLCLAVNHPDFVPARPECVVNTTPPSGAPWGVWRDELLSRITRKALFIRTAPIVLHRGETLKILVSPNSAGPHDTPLYAQLSSRDANPAGFWLRPQPGMLITHRTTTGPQTVRAVCFDAQGIPWFSDLTKITVTAGQTNECVVDLKPGVNVRGKLDVGMPRPVKNGRVIVHVWPTGERPQDYPPDWHAWGKIDADGNFEIPRLPAGDLEVVAICDGFVSTNGPGKFFMRYPQKYQLTTNDLDITIGMEPTAQLRVFVTDDKGNPLKDVRVAAWPNVRYGEWSATILGADCYNTGASLLSRDTPSYWDLLRSNHDFQGTTDLSGIAIVPNLPVDTKEIAVEHPFFDLPAYNAATGQKVRYGSITLTPGTNNYKSLQLEPRGKKPIAHY